jgi:hypothetical protein
VWEQILGPKPQPEKDSGGDILTLDAFRHNPDTPSFKPDYAIPAYDPKQVDPAKRHLFQEPSRDQQCSAATWQKVSNLGRPYEVHEEDRSSANLGKAAPLRYLAAKTSAPFFAAAMADASMKLSFPEEEVEDQELGLASRTTPRDPPRPYIPVLKSLQTNVRLLQTSLNVPRHRWHAANFPAPPEAEREFFQPAEVPKTCWQQMREDAYSWCQPEKAPPAGVEGATSAPKASSSKAHKVFPWNEARDTELHDLEALARDGLRMANASMIAFAHLLNGSLDPSKKMAADALRHSFYTINDLVYVQANQFARVAHKIALLRKLNVARSLNVADQGRLMKTKISSDLFGGQWPDIQAREAEARKKRAETKAHKEKERKVQQAASKSQPFRGNKNQEDRGQPRYSQQGQQQRPQQQKYAPSKQDTRQDKDKRDKKGGGQRRGRGRGGRK